MSEFFKKCNSNEYLLTPDGVWVRNPYKPSSPPISINHLIKREEYRAIVSNELENRRIKYMELADDYRENIVIISDGYGFKEKHKLLSKFPKVAVIAVNKALTHWELVGDSCENKKAISYYIINNPYPEAESFLPKNDYYPKCLISYRTFPKFVSNYKGPLYAYNPVPEKNHDTSQKTNMLLDDYRSPICAALSFCKNLRAKKILLMCCDNSFKDQRPGSVPLENGMFCYPQQNFFRNIIDANIYWMTKKEVKIGDFSSGRKLSYAEYIQDEQGMLDFFEGKNERQ